MTLFAFRVVYSSGILVRFVLMGLDQRTQRIGYFEARTQGCSKECVLALGHKDICCTWVPELGNVVAMSFRIEREDPKEGWTAWGVSQSLEEALQTVVDLRSTSGQAYRVVCVETTERVSYCLPVGGPQIFPQRQPSEVDTQQHNGVI